MVSVVAVVGNRMLMLSLNHELDIPKIPCAGQTVVRSIELFRGRAIDVYTLRGVCCVHELA